MNLKLIGVAIVTLFLVTASNLPNYVFAQSSDLGSQMDTAKKAAMAGMNQVKSAMKQKTIENPASVNDNKTNHFNQIRDKLMQSKFKPNPSAASR